MRLRRGLNGRRVGRITGVLLAGAATLLVGWLASQSATAAPSIASATSEPCAIRVLPSSFVETSTTGSVATVVQVSCEGSLAGALVKIGAQELWGRCNHHVNWVSPSPYESTSGEGIEVRLDAEANARVLVIAENCAAGESLVTADVEAEPYPTLSTSFDVLTPREAGQPETISVIPEAELPSFGHESLAAVVPVAFQGRYANQKVKIGAQELSNDCEGDITWIGPEATVLGSDTPSTTVQLDYDGRAFAAVVAENCGATPASLFYGELESGEHPTVSTHFVVEEAPPSSPGPRVAAVTPDIGPESGGTAVTITGTKFDGATKVRFGNTEAARFKVGSESSIEAIAPPGKGDVSITVTTPAGVSQRVPADAYRYIPPPTVSKLHPKGGPKVGGTLVTITGTNFVYEATTVKFGSTAGSHVTYSSEDSIAATAPPGVRGKVNITVTTPGGTSATTKRDEFTYR
jgi:hypothetical protein